MYETIVSPHNTSLKLAKGLLHSKQRKKTNQIIIEGFRMIFDALQSGVQFQFVIIDSAQLSNFQKLMEMLYSESIRVLVANPQLFNEISSTVTSQGIVAVVQKPTFELPSVSTATKVLILNRIQDPGNIGTLIRSADAFGLDQVIITKGSCDIYNPKALRSTMSSIFHLPVFDSIEQESCLNYLCANNIPILVTVPDSTAIDLTGFESPQKWAIVLGNEGNGVDEIWLERASYRLTIPMHGNAESLNVAMAGSIVMYHLSCLCKHNML